MSSRPNSANKTTTHKRSDSSGSHARHSSGSNQQQRSDSGNSIDSEYHSRNRHGHHRSKSSVQERERTESGGSQCKHFFYSNLIINFTIFICISILKIKLTSVVFH